MTFYSITNKIKWPNKTKWKCQKKQKSQPKLEWAAANNWIWKKNCSNVVVKEMKDGSPNDDPSRYKIVNRLTDGRKIKNPQWLLRKQLFEQTWNYLSPKKRIYYIWISWISWISLFIANAKILPVNGIMIWKGISYLFKITKTPQRMNVITTSNHPPTMNLKKYICIMVVLETSTEKHLTVGQPVIFRRRIINWKEKYNLHVNCMLVPKDRQDCNKTGRLVAIYKRFKYMSKINK